MCSLSISVTKWLYQIDDVSLQETRQKEAENDGYRKADVFEFNIYENGGNVQVKLQNIEWMSREATEKNVFNVSMLLCFTFSFIEIYSFTKGQQNGSLPT